MTRRNEWKAVGTLVPYLWEYKWRVVLALICLVTAKLANVGVPLVMKEVVDGLDPTLQLVAVPVAFVAGWAKSCAAVPSNRSNEKIRTWACIGFTF